LASTHSAPGPWLREPRVRAPGWLQEPRSAVFASPERGRADLLFLAPILVCSWLPSVHPTRPISQRDQHRRQRHTGRRLPGIWTGWCSDEASKLRRSMISLAQMRRPSATQAPERFSPQTFTVRDYGHVPAPVSARSALHAAVCAGEIWPLFRHAAKSCTVLLSVRGTAGTPAGSCWERRGEDKPGDTRSLSERDAKKQRHACLPQRPDSRNEQAC